MQIEVEFKGLDRSIKKLHKLGDKEREDAEAKALQAAGDVLAYALRQHLSMTAYTLADLQRMDHPYAERHGSIKIYAGREFVVHRRSNKMRDSITNKRKWVPGGYGGGGRYMQEIGLDYAKQKYFAWVIEGTKIMLPRNTIYLTSQVPKVRKGMMKAVVQVLGQELRTKATVRFG